MSKESPVNVLAVETSSPLLSVALRKGAEPVISTRVEGFLQHAESLLPEIARLLKKKKLGIRDIDVFLVGRGPGSFTGLRVGYATLKGFLALHKKACYGALSLDLVAGNLPVKTGAHLTVSFDAHRGKTYTRFLKEKRGRWQPEGPAEILPVEDLLERLPPDSFMAGDTCRRYEKQIRQSGKKIHISDPKLWYPSAEVLLSLYEQRRKSRPRPPLVKRLSRSEDLIPLYHRLPEAEERKKENARNR